MTYKRQKTDEQMIPWRFERRKDGIWMESWGQEKSDVIGEK